MKWLKLNEGSESRDWGHGMCDARLAKNSDLTLCSPPDVHNHTSRFRFHDTITHEMTKRTVSTHASEK